MINGKIEQHARQAEQVWGNAYQFFSSVIERHALTVGVEVGVAFGGHAAAILDRTHVSRLYGVDPYRHHPDYEDPMNLPQEEFDALFEFTIKRLSTYRERYRHLRMYSGDAVREIQGQVDFVYIDADHSYEGVNRDLCIWYDKVRIGGVIGGHDYGHVDFPGVAQAIDEYFGRLNWKIQTEGEGVWWVEKRAVAVSVFIPAYNCADTIKQSVASVFAENCSGDDELLIVNDGSSDDTDAVLKQLEQERPEIRILRHARNKGGAAARNTAVEAARHPILFCLDSDNLLAPDSLQRLKEFLVGSGADAAAFAEIRFFKQDTEKTDKRWVFKAGPVSFADCLSGPVVPGASGNYMFTKYSWECAKGYPEFAGALDAWGFGLRQVATGQKVYVMPASFYYHRYGHASYWTRDFRQGGPSLSALQILMPFLHQIADEDVDYIMGREGRYDWFENLDRRPLRLKAGGQGRSGNITHQNLMSRLGHVKFTLRRGLRKSASRIRAAVSVLRTRHL